MENTYNFLRKLFYISTADSLWRKVQFFVHSCADFSELQQQKNKRFNIHLVQNFPQLGCHSLVLRDIHDIKMNFLKSAEP